MAFKMKGDPFKRVATKSMKNSAYKQWNDPWGVSKRKDKGVKESTEQQRIDATKDAKRPGDPEKKSSEPFKQWDDPWGAKRKVEEAKKKQEGAKNVGEGVKDAIKDQSTFKQWDDPWGIESDRRMSDDRKNPDHRTLNTHITSARQMLDRYKRQAEESGSMADWRKYNEQLALFESPEAMWAGDLPEDELYNRNLAYGEGKTALDSRRISEDDLKSLQGYMDKVSSKYEPYSSPAFDKSQEFRDRLNEAKKNNDQEAAKQIIAEFKDYTKSHIAQTKGGAEGGTPDKI